MPRRYQTTDDVERRFGVDPAARPGGPTVKVPLTTGQHILHLLLTVFTAGLWLPVWIILAINGTRQPVAPATPLAVPVAALAPGERFSWGQTTVTVVTAPERGTETVPPLAGQPCIRIRGRREDTGSEGTMTFGLSAAVQVVP